MAWRRGVTGPSGVTPIVDGPSAEQTALCRHCCTLIRYFAADFTWRHVALGLDHAPEPLDGGPSSASSAAPELTESELRAMWGDR